MEPNSDRIWFKWDDIPITFRSNGITFRSRSRTHSGHTGNAFASLSEHDRKSCGPRSDCIETTLGHMPNTRDCINTRYIRITLGDTLGS